MCVMCFDRCQSPHWCTSLPPVNGQERSQRNQVSQSHTHKAGNGAMSSCNSTDTLLHSELLCRPACIFLSVDRRQTWDPGAGGSNTSSSSCFLSPHSLELWPWWLALHLSSPLQPLKINYFLKKKKKKKKRGGQGSILASSGS